MIRIIPILIFALLSSACVTIDNSGNWRPHDSGTNSSFYTCLQQAQQGHSEASLLSGSSGMKTNCQLLGSCMRAQGYQRRREPAWEMVTDVILSPIYFISMMGGACFE